MTTAPQAQLVFHGTLIHSKVLDELTILENAVLVVDPNDGRIIRLDENVPREDVPALLRSLGLDDADGGAKTRYLERTEFLIPGFVDTHNHAPQYAQRGLGQSMQILDWLSTVTFPNEARFADPAHAQRIYSRCVDSFLRQGITTAAYYGSLHAEATQILADLCLAKGQRALVGKCNMDRHAPPSYVEASPEASLRDTEACLAHVERIDPAGRLVRYVLTPRFAISCSDALLAGLGAIARRRPDLAIQTHVNEARSEMEFTRRLFPAFGSEIDLYEHFGLLSPRSILAHCCYMSEREVQQVAALGCGVAHCPVANMTVGGGFMAAPVRALLRAGVKVGLGTDSGGGFSSSLLDAARQALVASNTREVASEGEDRGLTIAELFYLATLGGAQVCGLEEKVGTFQVGKEFDALVINAADRAGGGSVMTMIEEEDSLNTIFEKFIMTGDDRNIEQVYVRGRLVKS
ncbi:hypothetical protein SLS62_009380 [Diatrype stigma]|uniref:Guanine deaminase n=1 Tax=Diatrype stigma TaxID=117547 RepID=A0AAN9YIS9_9PEZI